MEQRRQTRVIHSLGNSAVYYSILAAEQRKRQNFIIRKNYFYILEKKKLNTDFRMASAHLLQQIRSNTQKKIRGDGGGGRASFL
jgi:hypothetical protein